MDNYKDVNEIRSIVEKAHGVPFYGSIEYTQNTANYIAINRGHVVDFNGELFFVLGNMYESRFTLEEYPKHWVKSALELSTGKRKILKWVFDEDFSITISALTIKCFRSAKKEEEILQLTKDHPGFMQGKTVYDSKGKSVRILDYIEGKNLYRYLQDLSMPHEEYFFTLFPKILTKLVTCIESIGLLHTNNFFHGDIRNDHIIMEKNTDVYKWIDFDLNQHFSDFDVWSLGNILLFSAGKSEHTFYNVSQNKEINQKLSGSLNSHDASAFFKHRIINLQKIFPYVPDSFNDILMHFSINTNIFYDTVDQILTDLYPVLDHLT